MLSYDLYGTTLVDMEATKSALEGVLGCRFEARENDSIGLYYHAQTGAEESIKIRENADLHDNELSEPDFPDRPFFICVDRSSRPGEISKALLATGLFTLLRHEEF